LGTWSVILLDTHVLVWFFQGDPRMGVNARERAEAARRAEGIGVSAISPWEIAMLVEKKRMSLGRPTGDWINKALAKDGINLVPLEPAIAVEAGGLAGLHGDPADRIIIATARHHGAPLLTVDRAILAYGAAGHVQAIDAGL
jgi:PIN domain nuclease of toxin-antitoxin system